MNNNNNAHSLQASLNPARGGYLKPESPGEQLFERALALFLLLIASPVFVILAPLIRLHDGGPVFYAGIRLGRDKRPFTMYKFRTLAVNAEQQVGGSLLAPGSSLATPIGRVLRDVRVDELPQLYNVLRGDMSFFGPRPERPAVYEAQCKSIPNYDRRFLVRPGVLGYSQLYTPHSTPKRIRALIDNYFTARPQRIVTDLGLLTYSFSVLGWRTLARIARILWTKLVLTRRFGKSIERRTLQRMSPHGVCMSLADAGHGEERCSELVLGDINESHLLCFTDLELPERIELRMAIRFQRGGRSKRKTALCRGTLFRHQPMDSGGFHHAYVIAYEPATPFNRYLVDKYFTQRSIL